MRLSAIAVVVCCALLHALPAKAEKRVALVIGNSAYQNAPALPNPANDAGDTAAALTRLGFTVRTIANGTLDDMRKALRDFVPQARGAEMAVVYFAGHGMEIGGENWLLPVDAELKTDIAAEYEAIGLRSLLPVVGGATRLGLVVLDACRNNPFANRMQRSLPTRAVERGFARVEPTGSVLVAYAAKDGTTASDGQGRNSPFTAALLANIERPGLEINYLFRNVRDDVVKATGRKQEPFVYGALSREEIYLKAGARQSAAPAAAPPPAGPDAAERAWLSIQNTGSLAIMEDFVRQFGTTPYGSMARARIEELKADRRKSQSAALAPSPPPAPPPLRVTGLPAGLDLNNTVVIETTQGQIVIKLRPDLAPRHAERIKQLARDRFYDNAPFHRVIAGFMAQTGDGQRGNGTGGSKYPNLPAEFSTTPFKRGIVGMARAATNDSANSQFFIMTADGSYLDGKYTVVGEVVAGMEIVDKLQKGEPAKNPDRMTRVQVAAEMR